MKLIATDFDGTYCRYNEKTGGQLTREDREAVALWRAAGNKLVIVTGRPLIRVKDVVRLHQPECDGYICCTGAIVCTPELRMQSTVEGDASRIPELLSLAAEFRCPYLDIHRFSDCRRVMCDTDAAQILSACRDPEDPARPGLFHQLNTAYKTTAEAAVLAEAVNRRMGDVFSAYCNFNNVDIPPAGQGKPSGIRRYAAMTSIPENRIYTIGDAANDIPMLREFNGSAIAGAQPEVLACADRVFGSLAEMIHSLL